MGSDLNFLRAEASQTETHSLTSNIDTSPISTLWELQYISRMQIVVLQHEATRAPAFNACNVCLSQRGWRSQKLP